MYFIELIVNSEHELEQFIRDISVHPFIPFCIVSSDSIPHVPNRSAKEIGCPIFLKEGFLVFISQLRNSKKHQLKMELSNPTLITEPECNIPYGFLLNVSCMCALYI